MKTSTIPAADANRTAARRGRRRGAGPFSASVVATALAALIAAAALAASGQALPEGGDITGVVRSTAGLEEGVWVIAETDDLATRFIKSVVTGNGGRFLIPDLPPARYEVWVRGYGLVDSARVEAGPGDELALEAVVAATEAEAAKVYPANYWYSLIEPPASSEFPGTGADGNGIATTLIDQSQWVDIQKQGCMLCHQLGSRIVREIDNRDEFDSTLAAWDHRVQMGQRGSQMTNVMNRFGRSRGLEMFADWSDRIAAGAVPPRPPRSATSSSRCGSGATRSTTSTTRSRPTSGTRPSTRTGRSTA
ncbi:MAG: carboxypeptidase regulatory-like domain-containing protein [Acidobacteria bacterium]|nr:carboxypeptidase regulatory-like domain-containing protein [Acidobacteriota bacterium]